MGCFAKEKKFEAWMCLFPYKKINEGTTKCGSQTKNITNKKTHVFLPRDEVSRYFERDVCQMKASSPYS